jgi:FecR protein
VVPAFILNLKKYSCHPRNILAIEKVSLSLIWATPERPFGLILRKQGALMKRTVKIATVFALALLGSLTFLSMAQAAEVGHFSQVVNQVEYLKQGKGPPQPAKVKDGVENRDMVRTAQQSRAMMRFIDDTTMTVGPKSELTIEEYMYDASKGRRQAVVQLLSGVVETVAPQVASPGKSEFTLRTPTATAGIRGTKYITVVGPDFTMFYVLSGKIKVKTYSPDLNPNSPAMKCIADQLKQKVPFKDIIDHCLAAGIDPCALIKAAVWQGVSLEEIVKAFLDKCLIDPELKEVCTPCVIMKCAVQALRAMKEEDVGAGKYALLMEKLAPITGNLTAANLAQIASIVENGVPTDLSTLPGYTISEAQRAEASLPGATQLVAETMISAGFDPNAVQNCPEVGAYTPPPLPPIIAPTVPPSLPSGGGPPFEPPPVNPPPVVSPSS